MAVPDYVPLRRRDLPEEPVRLPPPPPWKARRPGDLAGAQPLGAKLGRPGPDQGYGLVLAHRRAEQVELAPGEHREDAVAGCLGVGLKRAALFGRAPVIHDFELAYTVWGFLPGAPADLVGFRRPLFEEVRHDYWRQREIADRVPEATLRLTPAQVGERLGDWRSLLVVEGVAA
jgi:hypothetical protein